MIPQALTALRGSGAPPNVTMRFEEERELTTVRPGGISNELGQLLQDVPAQWEDGSELRRVHIFTAIDESVTINVFRYGDGASTVDQSSVRWVGARSLVLRLQLANLIFLAFLFSSQEWSKPNTSREEILEYAAAVLAGKYNTETKRNHAIPSNAAGFGDGDAHAGYELDLDELKEYVDKYCNPSYVEMSSPRRFLIMYGLYKQVCLLWIFSVFCWSSMGRLKLTTFVCLDRCCPPLPPDFSPLPRSPPRPLNPHHTPHRSREPKTSPCTSKTTGAPTPSCGRGSCT